MAERASDLVEWQHRGDQFKRFSHKLGELDDFHDSMQAYAIDTLMNNTVCQDEDGFLARGERPFRDNRRQGLRGYVSLKKKRLKRDTFDLDLAYITTRVIAMGFPAKGLQSTFRNSRDDVICFLDTYHPTHHKIYNLCSELERYYSIKDFPNTPVSMYPIKDHYPANVFLMFVFSLDAYFYMREKKENVIAVHCKAGKGRTGMMIASFLLFSGLCKDYIEAIQYYGRRRSYDWLGVSIPSQIRSVQQFETFLVEEFGPDFATKQEYMVQRYDVISQQLRARMERPFLLQALWLTSPRGVRQFTRKALVSIGFQDQARDFCLYFRPRLTSDGVFFIPDGTHVVVSGDFCIRFKKTHLKFSIWVNPTFFKGTLKREEADRLTVSADSSICSTFKFRRERPELARVEGRDVVTLSRKCKSDFDSYQTDFTQEEQESLQLTVVCSTQLVSN